MKYPWLEILIIAGVCLVGVTVLLIYASKEKLLPSQCTPALIQLRIISNRRPGMGPLERDFWQHAIANAAERHGIPAPELTAKIAIESGFLCCTVSLKGARGPSQLMPMWWEKGVSPFEIEWNLDKGAEVLESELKAADGDMFKAFRRYNGGGTNWDKTRETEIYANSILSLVYLAERAVCHPQVKHEA